MLGIRNAALVALLCVAGHAARAQSCHWDGTAPFCNGSCGGNQRELTRLAGIPDFWVPPFVSVTPPFGSNCATGSKALCCSSPGYSCRWDGTAPFCSGSCNKDEVESSAPAGSSSGQPCATGHKVYCCKRETSTAALSLPLTGTRDCAYGPDTCIKGYVWREANPQDHACVTPDVRDATRKDNAEAAARRSPNGGPSGPDTCRQGFVWREAYGNDHTCVTPQTRSQAAQDNHWIKVRDACP